jgi:hypothetical protein
MDQLQQANVGNPENILQSVQAAEYSPLKSQMELGVRLMDAGFQGGSATNRQAMTNQAAMDRDRFEEQANMRTEQRTERSQRQSDLGTLTQIIAEFDDVIDNADMNDPVAQERIPALIRKRMQLADLFAQGGRNGKYLGGILKQGTESGFLTTDKQGLIREMTATKAKEEAEKNATSEGKPKEKTETSSDNASSNVISL